ncbi:MAG: hypothetical protein ACLQBA_03720, partial [Candidatus Binataceae bacterium]
EAYVLGLFQLYPTLYFHKATRGAEKIFTELLVHVVTLARDGAVAATGLPDRHPLIRFALAPDDIDSALCLDDSVVWGALSLMAEATNPLISQFSARLRDRKLYKCINVRTRVANAFDPTSTNTPELVATIDRCCAGINEKLKGWIDDNASEVPRLLIDEAVRSPYQAGGGSKGPTEQINVLTDGGSPVDLKQRSRVVAALSNFKLFRVYHSDEDGTVRQKSEQIIAGEVRSCR